MKFKKTIKNVPIEKLSQLIKDISLDGGINIVAKSESTGTFTIEYIFKAPKKETVQLSW